MPAINRYVLLEEVKFYLGHTDECSEGASMNRLPDSIILSIVDSVILEVGDDTQYYAEVKCKTLRDCAIQNKAIAKLNVGRGVRREKSNFREIEYFNSNPSKYWDEFLRTLPELCSSFGYCSLPSPYAGALLAGISRPVEPPPDGDYYRMPSRLTDD